MSEDDTSQWNWWHRLFPGETGLVSQFFVWRLVWWKERKSNWTGWSHTHQGETSVHGWVSGLSTQRTKKHYFQFLEHFVMKWISNWGLLFFRPTTPFETLEYPPKRPHQLDVHLSQRRAPVTRREFNKLFDADGRLVDEHKLRQEVFRGRRKEHERRQFEKENAMEEKWRKQLFRRHWTQSWCPFMEWWNNCKS